VQFSTTLGTFNHTVVTTDNSGAAVSTLTGNGQLGTAKVMAFSGDVMSTEVDVMIGAAEALITLQATPSTIGQDVTTNVQLVALVRDAQGNPVAGSPVSFSSQAGTLKSHGNFVLTDSTGAAHDVLTVTAQDLVNQTGSSFNVGVQGSTGTAVTFAINIARAPVANFTATVTNGNLSVSFTDTSTNHPTSWMWDFGDPASGSANHSTVENPAHTFSAPGTYIVTLTAANAIGSGSTSQAVTVTGPP
jgi:PKD repeat protein